jgi:hypothetical protein
MFPGGRRLARRQCGIGRTGQNQFFPSKQYMAIRRFGLPKFSLAMARSGRDRKRQIHPEMAAFRPAHVMPGLVLALCRVSTPGRESQGRWLHPVGPCGWPGHRASRDARLSTGMPGHDGSGDGKGRFMTRNVCLRRRKADDVERRQARAGRYHIADVA